MGLDNRTRDFSAGTLGAMRERLQGPRESYGVFSGFLRTYGDCFDTDFSQEAHSIDAQMTELREFMHGTVPAALDAVDERAAAHQATYSAVLDGILEQLAAYNAMLDALKEEIARPRFGVAFNPTAFQARLDDLKPAFATDEQAFVADMMAQYGFSKETAQTLWKLWEGIAREYDDETEAAWAFNRILGGLWYDHDDNNLFRQFLVEAGGTHPGFLTWVTKSEQEFFEWLGLTETEYTNLRREIRMQHLIQAHQGSEWEKMPSLEKGLYDNFIEEMKNEFGETISLDELETKWNEYVAQYSGKTDFAHQSIASGVYLAEILGKTSFFANVYSNNRAGEYASWYGDICEGDGKISNDDYKADLDATNINFYMTEYGMSYLEARRNYYEDVNSGQTTRAEIFTQPGNVPLEQVEIDLINRYGGKNLRPEKMTAEERRTWMAENMPNTNGHDPYRFWQSLEAGTNDMVK